MEAVTDGQLRQGRWPGWVIHFSLASKWKNATAFSPSNIASLVLILFLVWLLTGLLCWPFPGGHAWGKYWWTRGLFRHLSTIPGPRGIPFLGSMSLMTGLSHRHLAMEAERLNAKRLMAFSVGESRTVVTCNPQVAKDILNNPAFVDRPAKESAYKLRFHKSIGFAPYGDYWRTLRKIAAVHLFSPKQISKLDGPRFRIAAEMVAEIKNQVGEVVSIRNLLKLAALKNIMCLTFGQLYLANVSDAETRQVQEQLLSLLEEGSDLLGKLDLSDHLPLLSSLDIQRIRSRCNKLLPRINRLVQNMVSGYRQLDHTAGKCFVDVLLSIQSSENLSDADINAVVWEMIFRGTDTVAVLAEWAMARMVLHQEVQKKAQEELDKVVGRSRAVAESDLFDLVYIQSIVKETLRLHPPGPLLSWARLSRYDTVVDGHYIPAGTTGMVNMWAITHDPQVWERPLEFDPARFLSREDDDAKKVSVFGSDLELAPFGSGRRSCPGKLVGVCTVEFWVATLLHEFQWFPASTRGVVDLSENLRLTCGMVEPLTVKIQTRCT